MAYKGALMVDDDELFSSFQRCAAIGALPLVHAENGDVVAQLQAKLMAEQKKAMAKKKYLGAAPGGEDVGSKK